MTIFDEVIVDKLLAKGIRKDSGCLEWPGARIKKKQNYGVFRLNGQTLYVHRFVYCFKMNLSLDTELDVRHKCDNYPCFEYEHLIDGTRKDNMQDAKERNRLPRGNQKFGCYTTLEQVREIRSLIGIKNNAEIARLLDLPYDAVRDIYRGKTWVGVE